MKIDEKTYKIMPVELQAMFRKLPNPGSDEVVGLFPETGASNDRPRNNQIATGERGIYGRYEPVVSYGHADSGSAARFFYCAKASKKERNEGLPKGVINKHPTVKPTSLMRYLCRLVTPPNGLILDSFCGSGSTGKAAILEGFRFIGIEVEEEYCAIARVRIAYVNKKDYEEFLVEANNDDSIQGETVQYEIVFDKEIELE